MPFLNMMRVVLRKLLIAREVKEHQIDVLEVKLLKRLVNGGLGLLIAHLLAPDFGGYVKIAPLEAKLLVSALYLSSNKCFVLVVLSGV